MAGALEGLGQAAHAEGWNVECSAGERPQFVLQLRGELVANAARVHEQVVARGEPEGGGRCSWGGEAAGVTEGRELALRSRPHQGPRLGQRCVRESCRKELSGMMKKFYDLRVVHWDSH